MRDLRRVLPVLAGIGPVVALVATVGASSSVLGVGDTYQTTTIYQFPATRH